MLVGRAPLHQPMDEAGLYVRDTRFLSVFSLRLNGEQLQVLDCQSSSPDRAVITRTNPPAEDDAVTGIAPHSLLVRTDVILDSSLQAGILVRNYGALPLVGLLELDVGSDFRDMFDVRGMTPSARATPLAPVIEQDAVKLSARSVDGQLVTTLITKTPSPRISSHPPGRSSGATLGYDLDLAPGEDVTIEVRISPNPVGAPLEASSTVDTEGEFTPRVTVRSSSEAFDRFVRQCDADLALLQTSFPDGTIPAAGIPWYIAPFGRDSLIVGLQTMHSYPDRVASTLRVLGALQASEDDPWREAQPGKILHEMRYGDMARTGQVPHTPYFGSIDATPLFVMLFAEHYLWHRDDGLFDALIDNIRRALGWIERHGDLDGDGLIEFSGLQQDLAHISQQGWKDSFDSLHFADGGEVEGPIALVEVQGYVYAAFRWLGEAVRLRGEETWADELQAKAEWVREAVETEFWMEDAGYYAQALDGQKRQVDAISSNPGHLLFCGLPSADRAGRVAERMGRPDLNAGWGIRTLGTGMPTYNPMSYHNGSVWPHDCSLAMAGLRAYGHDELANALAMDLLALAASSPDWHLAELYCGFAPTGEQPRPVAYPVSCIPQAWAAGAGLLALRTLLGLRPDAGQRVLTARPHLPDGWSSLTVTGLHAFGRRTDVSVERNGEVLASTVSVR